MSNFIGMQHSETEQLLNMFPLNLIFQLVISASTL